MIQVRELSGYKSLRALNAFSALVLGLKMLPAYMGETYESFLDRLQKMAPEDQRKMLREAAMFVELAKEEVEALVFFCSDKNGIPFDSTNIGNLKPDQLIEIIVEVSMKIAEIKIDFVTPNEKKN